MSLNGHKATGMAFYWHVCLELPYFPARKTHFFHEKVN